MATLRAGELPLSFGIPLLPACLDEPQLRIAQFTAKLAKNTKKIRVVGATPQLMHALQWGQRERPARLTQLAATNRWSVHDYPLLALADVDDAAAEMAALWGVATLPPIRGLEAGKRPDRAAVGRVLLLYGIDPPSALGPGSFHHELLVDLGATPALTEGRAFMTLDAEDVLRLAPDAVMIFNPRAAHDANQPVRRLSVVIEAPLHHPLVVEAALLGGEVSFPRTTRPQRPQW